MSPLSDIEEFFLEAFPGSHISSIESIHTGGSDRNYYRIADNRYNSFILVDGSDRNENREFISLTRTLEEADVSVPHIIYTADDDSKYLLTDLGSMHLLDIVTSSGPEEYVPLYEKSIDELIKVQTVLGISQKEKLLRSNRIYSKELVLHDLMYFLYDFVKISSVEFDPSIVLNNLVKWAEQLAEFKVESFMYRDFQSRNIMVYRERCYLIDYQGGLWGPATYDMASLLYQAKAELPDDIKSQLWNDYLRKFIETHPETDVQSLNDDFQKCTFLRLLQVLGAYGYRGLVQQKPHFLSSIPLALENLNTFIIQNPEFYIPDGFLNVLKDITREDFISKFK